MRTPRIHITEETRAEIDSMRRLGLIPYLSTASAPDRGWSCRYCEIDSIGRRDLERRPNVNGVELYITADRRRMSELDGMTLEQVGGDRLRLRR